MDLSRRAAQRAQERDTEESKEEVRMTYISSVMVLIVAAGIFSEARAEDAHGKLTVAQAVSVLQGLRGLDGHQIVIKQNGQDVVILQPWEFGNGVLRLKITNDIAILAPVEQQNEQTRQAILREVTKGKPTGFEIKIGTPEADEFSRQWDAAQAQPAPGTQDLARFSLNDLRLDKNEIPGTVTAQLKPILD